MDLFEIRLAAAEMCDVVSKAFSDDLFELIKTKTFLAGGVFKSLILNEAPNDWDFWFRDKESAEKFSKALDKLEYTIPSYLSNRDKLKLSKIMVKTDNAYTFKFPRATIQFIIAEVGSPQEVIGRYDFAHTQCYFDPFKSEMVCPTKYAVSKQLVFNPKATTPLSALKRAFKFCGQGWTIKDNDIEAIIKAVSGIDWKSPEVVKKQTRGLYSQAVETRPEAMPDEAPPARWGTDRVMTRATPVNLTGDGMIAATNANMFGTTFTIQNN
jgi:hypothetical protein